MNNPTKRLLQLITALCLLTACGKTYTGDDEPDGGGGGTGHSEEYPVMLAISDPSYIILTRGTGAFDKENDDAQEKWEESVFYIYSFHNSNTTDYRTTRGEDPENCLIDGSHMGSRHGKMAMLNRDRESYLSWTDTSEAIYYSTENQVRPFHFFAYYIDDLNIDDTSITRQQDRISFPVKIDGSRDIMSGIARLTETQLESIARHENKEQLMENHFSTYSAHRSIQPILTFRHQLCRLKFEIYPGSQEAEDIYVESVRARSRTEGTFTVAARDTTLIGLSFPENAAYEELYLRDKKGTPLLTDTYHVALLPEEEDRYVYDRTGVRVGESLLLAPDNAYDVTMVLKQSFPDKEPLTYNTYYNLKVDGGFQAGVQYTIRVAVFGAEEISIQVVIDGWINGGNIDVDPGNVFD